MSPRREPSTRVDLDSRVRQALDRAEAAIADDATTQQQIDQLLQAVHEPNDPLEASAPDD